MRRATGAFGRARGDCDVCGPRAAVARAGTVDALATEAGARSLRPHPEGLGVVSPQGVADDLAAASEDFGDRRTSEDMRAV